MLYIAVRLCIKLLLAAIVHSKHPVTTATPINALSFWACGILFADFALKG